MENLLAIILSQGYTVTLAYHPDRDRYSATALRKGRTQERDSRSGKSLGSALSALLRYMLSNLALAHDAEDYRKLLKDEDDGMSG